MIPSRSNNSLSVIGLQEDRSYPIDKPSASGKEGSLSDHSGIVLRNGECVLERKSSDKGFTNMLDVQDEMCCGRNDGESPRSLSMEQGNGRTSESFMQNFFGKLVEVYHNGMIPSEKFKKNKAAMTVNSPVFVSEKEKYYASRWEGLQPLAPMPALDAAHIQKQSLRRAKLSKREASMLPAIPKSL